MATNPSTQTESHESILVINCGSSSLKFALIDTGSEKAILSGVAERIGSQEALIQWKDKAGKQKKDLPGANLVACLKEMISILPTGSKVVAVGHRVVHGAEEFSGSVLLTEEVMAAVERCNDLAPLHNPANIEGIRAAQEVFPGIPQVGVFDTAFHQTLPPKAYLYPVPYEWYKEDGVRRYGFHGTSHRFVSEEAARRLKKPIEKLSMITAHLGNGCSAAAVDGGKSVDTTMGISPLEGLMMGTRSGDVDPSLHEFIATKRGWSMERIMKALNRESGLLGISGISNDMRTLVEASEEGNERATLAIEVFCFRLAKSIMGLCASLPKLDALVFTGGIGEHSQPVREKTVENLKVLGVSLDPDLNKINGDDEIGKISNPGSVLCLVIPTNEELMIARETIAVTK